MRWTEKTPGELAELESPQKLKQWDDGGFVQKTLKAADWSFVSFGYQVQGKILNCQCLFHLFMGALSTSLPQTEANSLSVCVCVCAVKNWQTVQGVSCHRA